MTIDPARIHTLAEAYTAAWNSGSSDAVAAFFAPDGQIVINRGKPWLGREGVAAMAAGFFADVPDQPAAGGGLGGVGPRCRPAGHRVTRLVRHRGLRAPDHGSVAPTDGAGWSPSRPRPVPPGVSI